MRFSTTAARFAHVVLAALTTRCKDSNNVTGPGSPAATYSVSGTVTRGGHPAGNVTVRVVGVGDVTTAADGTFAMQNVPAGTWTVFVVTGCIECAGFSTKITVPPDVRGLQLIWEED